MVDPTIHCHLPVAQSGFRADCWAMDFFGFHGLSRIPWTLLPSVVSAACIAQNLYLADSLLIV